jgi:hypothetical protein
MPTSDAYNHAVVSSSLKVKTLVALLLSAMFALFVGQVLKSLEGFDRAISEQTSVRRLQGK